jgi:hypothetical protein
LQARESDELGLEVGEKANVLRKLSDSGKKSFSGRDQFYTNLLIPGPNFAETLTRVARWYIFKPKIPI